MLLPGIEVPQTIFEIVGRVGQVAAETRELRTRYELGLGTYRLGDWPAARSHFSDCLGIAPADGPTQTMLERIETLAAKPEAAAGWSSVWRLRKDDLP